MSAFVVAFVAIFVLLTQAAAAQDAPSGAGKIELGLAPMGGTFFVGGDDKQEVNFNVYTSAGNISYYVNERTAVEGELSISFGWAQDLFFNGAELFSVQVPNPWSYFANVVFFPGGSTGRHLASYVTGGVGALALQSRQPTKQFGYDVDTVGFETFIAENVGGGVKMFRSSVPDWGFRLDYRYLIVNSNSDAPAFFAKTKSRGGHRIYFGVLYTARR